MAVEQQTLGTSSLLVDVTDTGHGIANPAADLAEADLVEADGKQTRLSRSSSLGQDPDQIEVMFLKTSRHFAFLVIFILGNKRAMIIKIRCHWKRELATPQTRFETLPL